MSANQVELGTKIAAGLAPMFTDLGLTLDSFVVENLSLPDELQKMLDTRVGMNMLGDMNKYTQYQVANSLPIAAANESGGIAGLGVGLGAGLTMANVMTNALRPGENPPSAPAAPTPAGPAPTGASPIAGAETKFCFNCGKPIGRVAKFCPECGTAQP
jgi:membrane protease subunit (stomatin/prohibitin family)